IVSGLAVPELAGIPGGYISQITCDTTPSNSPLLVSGTTLHAGDTLEFSASGSVSFGQSVAFYGPDGGPPPDPSSGNHPAENGISGIKAPLCSLLGVFLDDARPDTAPPPPDLDFLLPTSQDYLTIAPL